MKSSLLTLFISFIFLNVGLAQFFANAVNTTNRGIDIVIDYNKKCGSSRYRLLTTANFQRMSINKINVPNKLNDTESHQVIENRLSFLPQHLL